MITQMNNNILQTVHGHLDTGQVLLKNVSTGSYLSWRIEHFNLNMFSSLKLHPKMYRVSERPKGGYQIIKKKVGQKIW